MTDQFAINPYAPPKANLDGWVTPATVQAFPRLSTWWVLVLGVVTLGRLRRSAPLLLPRPPAIVDAECNGLHDVRLAREKGHGEAFRHGHDLGRER